MLVEYVLVRVSVNPASSLEALNHTEFGSLVSAGGTTIPTQLWHSEIAFR